MNNQETAVLCRYVRSLCPQQKFDEYTPDAWHDVLGEHHLDDARTAAARIARRQPFVAPAEIAAEIRTIRAERLDGFMYVPQPDDDDPRRYLANVRAQRDAVASGLRPADPGILAPTRSRPVGELLSGIGRPVPTAEPPDPKPRKVGPHGIHCPKCKATIGRPCRLPGGKQRTPHPARVAAALGEPTTADAQDEIVRRREVAKRHLAALPDDAVIEPLDGFRDGRRTRPGGKSEAS